MMDDYVRLVSELPLPTVEQTQAFANHVVGAHSWYKHLPVFPPGDVFLFFLDPQAGRSIKECGGQREFAAMFGDDKGVTRPRIVIEDIEDRSQCWHYSMKPTRDYLEQFGYWNYCCCSFEKFHTVRPGVWSLEKVELGPDTTIEPFDVPLRVNLSDKVRQQCFCQLTAFIRGYARHRCSLKQLPEFLRDFSSYLEEKSESSWATTLRKTRWDLEEAGVYGWEPNAICDVDITPTGSALRVWEVLPNNHSQLKRSVSLKFDFGSLAAQEHSDQKDALLNGLQRSRELFAKVCRKSS